MAGHNHSSFFLMAVQLCLYQFTFDKKSMFIVYFPFKCYREQYTSTDIQTEVYEPKHASGTKKKGGTGYLADGLH